MSQADVLEVLSQHGSWMSRQDVERELPIAYHRTTVATNLGKLVRWRMIEREDVPVERGGRLARYRRRTA